jgi:hypothetical protein
MGIRGVHTVCRGEPIGWMWRSAIAGTGIILLLLAPLCNGQLAAQVREMNHAGIVGDPNP